MPLSILTPKANSTTVKASDLKPMQIGVNERGDRKHYYFKADFGFLLQLSLTPVGFVVLSTPTRQVAEEIDVVPLPAGTTLTLTSEV